MESSNFLLEACQIQYCTKPISLFYLLNNNDASKKCQLLILTQSNQKYNLYFCYAFVSNQYAAAASGTIKTATPIDLVIMHSQECSILTNVQLSSKNADTSGFTKSSSMAAEIVTVYLDGKPVPVASGDDGQVTFCDRTYYVLTNILSQIQQLCAVTNTTCAESQFNSFINTKDAHAFNWNELSSDHW